MLHLEPQVPTWEHLVVDGLVHRPLRLDLAALAVPGAETRQVAMHCVWGWSRPDACWEGIGLNRLMAAAEPMRSGVYVTVRSASGTYSSCLEMADAVQGMLVWRRDGEDLPAEAGGPLRFLPPPEYWAYKGVKWASRVTVVDRFVPGSGSSRWPFP